MIPRTSRLPNARIIDAAGPCESFAPHVIEHNGASYLMVHAQSMSTGVIRQSDLGEAGDRCSVTIWSNAPSGQPLGLALVFTPDDVMIDHTIASLTRIRDMGRAAARDQADAAFAKARGK